MTYNNPNDGKGQRDYARGTSNRGSRTTWAVFAVAALVIVGVFMLYNSGGHGPSSTTVSSKDSQGALTTTAAPGRGADSLAR
jgi:hypothetical protein